MTKPKEISFCKHCGTAIKPNKSARYCSLKCSFENRLTPGGGGDCWLWHGCKNDSGYGQIRYAGAVHYTHRIAYELKYGPLGSLKACHKCDTPACCNPGHIIAGTQAENMEDMRRKGRGMAPPRGPRGRKAFGAKYTHHQIAHILDLLKQGMTQAEVARATGMSPSHVGNLRKGLHL